MNLLQRLLAALFPPPPCPHEWDETDTEWNVQGDMDTAIQCLYNTHVRCRRCHDVRWIPTTEYAANLRGRGLLK